ncbi:DUF3426 domain-containing protein [Halopseudomonas laoshanensis]|uniref:DUF3426 domain-containing protein n=1 Tax=Halopseudomonas laoshanensis TaxID=2268758 RepID=UPI0037359AB8
MNEMLVAQCPHCQTRFRLSQDHLQAAAGNVRCGACLKVFDARAQINSAEPEPSPAPDAAKTPPPPPAAGEPGSGRQGSLLIHDDLELDDLDLEALGLDESILEEINPDARTTHSEPEHPTTEPSADISPAAAPSSASIDPEVNAPEPVEPTDSDSTDVFVGEHSDEEIQLLAEPEPFSEPLWDDAPATDDQAAADEPPRADPQNNWTPTDADIERAFEFDSARDKPDAWDLDFNLDNDLADKPPYTANSSDPLDDIELHEAFRNAASSRDFAPRPLPPEPLPTDDRKPDPFDMDSPPSIGPLSAAPPEQGIFLRDQPFLLPNPEPRAKRPQPSEETPASTAKRAPQERREPSLDSTGFGDDLQLPELIDEPLYLDDRPRARRPRRQWLWTLLSIIAALALLGQVATYNYAALAHNERTRPIMEQVCFLAGCQLPARVNIDLIRSSNLVVRPHSDFPNALAIDVILYNRADFAQPFPVLRMTFSDLAGREISSKLFQPVEYLGGELAGTTLMPPQTPVHVGLSMLDPGSNVASYNLDFLSP